jgi:type VI secretion system secreted protein VgrG
MPLIELSFSSGEASLSVRRFSVREALSTLFRVEVSAVSSNHDIDFSTIVGEPASLQIRGGAAGTRRAGERAWRGVCSAMAQARTEPSGLTSYELTIVPALWLLSKRRDYRIYQQRSVPEIVREILDRWSIRSAWRIEATAHPKREYRVQHGESDLDFVSRLLEEAGIAYTFDDEDEGAAITLSDQLHADSARDMPPIPYADNPNRSTQREYITRITLARAIRPGAQVLRDYDLRNPGYALFGRAEVQGLERRFEQYTYAPGAFLIEDQKGGGTPVADGRSVARHDEPWGNDLAERAQEAEREGERAVTYETNVADLRPGTLFVVENHPVGALAGHRLLATHLALDGTPFDAWTMEGRAVFTDAPFRPPRRTPKPRARGFLSATVVGPAGQEIHPDEFGRVRARFPWDRYGKSDDTASCWLRVSQGWAGAGFGWTTLPRIGQEVLVAFFEGDPDQPVIAAGAYNGANLPPHPLPEKSTISAWRSNSSPGGDGFNEILFEDAARREVVYFQAQRDLSQLVQRNETVTIGGEASKLVKGDEAETTGKDRVRVTEGSRRKRVNGESAARVEGQQARRVGASVDTIVKGTRRSLVAGDAHGTIHGEDRITIESADSSIVGEDRGEVVWKRHAVEAESTIHWLSLLDAVMEGVKSVTLKAPSGFVHIDESGITIKGALVKINSGGAAGVGGGSRPEEPEPPREVEAFDAPMPHGEPTPEGEIADRRPRVDPAVKPVEPTGPEPAPTAALAWIEIRLVDDEGQPLAGELYRITTPDGRRRDGYLNADGYAREEGFVPGMCKVAFPNIDRDTWNKSGASGAT